MGAARVSAWDISERARANAYAAGVVVDVRRGSLDRALARGPYDIVVSNPPYVPAPKGPLGEAIPDEAGSPWAYNAGEDGRMGADRTRAALVGRPHPPRQRQDLRGNGFRQVGHDKWHRRRDRIGQAKGIIMERYGVDDVRAFQMLRQLSQEQNIKLIEVAEQVIGTRDK